MNMLALNNQTFLTVHVKQDFLFFQQTVIDNKIEPIIQRYIKMNGNTFRKNVLSFTVSSDMAFFFFPDGRLGAC